MSYIDHDLGPDGPTRAPVKPVTTQRTPSGAQPPLLDLQRLAGNAAVSGAIRRGQLDPSLSVQRVQADEEEETEGYENDTEVAQEAEQATEEAGEAAAYGEADTDVAKDESEGYENETEVEEDAEQAAEEAGEAAAYGETEESEDETKED